MVAILSIISGSIAILLASQHGAFRVVICQDNK